MPQIEVIGRVNFISLRSLVQQKYLPILIAQQISSNYTTFSKVVGLDKKINAENINCSKSRIYCN